MCSKMIPCTVSDDKNGIEAVLFVIYPWVSEATDVLIPCIAPETVHSGPTTSFKSFFEAV